MEEIVEELLTDRILTAVKNRNAKDLKEIFARIHIARKKENL